MKKLLLTILILTTSTALFAYDLGDVKASFQTFADETASALPLATSLGLNWNDAYVGSFPHFGAGLTGGAVFLPTEAFEEVYSLTGSSDDLEDFTSLGIPLPVYSFDARLGLPFIPADVGFKAGVLNPDMLPLDDYTVDFLMIGGDFRWAIIEDKGLMPDVSIGVGYTWLRGDISAPVDDQSIDINGTGAGSTLTLADSEMNYSWNTNVIDLKAQVSKKLLIFNLSAGAAYSYGFSTAGGGMTASTVEVDGNAISADNISDIEDATGVDIDSTGLEVLSEVDGGTFRLFGGLGIDLFVFNIDLGAVYGWPTGTLGLSGNVRFQL